LSVTGFGRWTALVIFRKGATLKPSQFIPFGQVDDAYDKLHAESEELKRNLEFAYKRAKVLADLLGIPIHESPEVTGTILGLVRGSVERLVTENERLQKRDGNAVIIICETTETIPFHQERMKIIDFGVSDNIYMVERDLEI
jgi:hypothetical protein